MIKSNKPEVWLRGPLNDIPPLLQPVAHALLQGREEINELLAGFPDDQLWDNVAGMASVGFHLQHLKGMLDRLFTYAGNKQLTVEQLNYLANEGKAVNTTTAELLNNFNTQVDISLNRLTAIDSQTLTDKRGVGKAQLPSTVIGILVHAAEHTMRHMWQLLVTVKVLEK